MIINNITTSMMHFIPEILLFIMAMVILLAGIFKISKNYIFHLTLTSVLGALLLNYNYQALEPLILFDLSIIKNRTTEFFKYICYIVFLIQIIISKNYLKNKKLLSGEFYSLLLFALLGCFIIISANNLIILFLGIELSSLSLYSLIALNRYSITNSLIISDITSFSFSENSFNLHLLSYVLIFIGIAFKFAVAPFHMWLPDVYEGSPLPVTNFISSIPKIAFFVIAYRFLDNSSVIVNENFSNLLLFLGVFSIILGNFFALAQRKIMRMLAYSGVANSGFIFLAIFSAINYNFSVAGFYVLSYSITIVSAISIITFLSSRKFDLVYINDFKGFSAKSGYLSFLIMITLLSTAGIPLTVGFYAKYLVLDALISKDLIFVAVIVVLMTVVGLYYYLRVIWFMFFETNFNGLINTEGKFSIFVLSIIPALILIIFLVPDDILKYIFYILT